LLLPSMTCSASASPIAGEIKLEEIIDRSIMRKRLAIRPWL
jgi:hypothetical protein